MTVCAPAAEQAAFAEADRRIEGYALPVERGGARFVVVSTQGRGDEAALQAALAVEADYVAFVGSRREGRGAEGEAPRTRRRRRAGWRSCKSPAGLDLGAITPEEIALSILAEIVAVRSSTSPCAAERRRWWCVFIAIRARRSPLARLAILQAETEAADCQGCRSAGSYNAEILPSRNGAKLRLMSATIASAESGACRFDQSFSAMKACAVFWP